MTPESEKKVPESDKKYLKKAGGHIGRNVVQITMKMRTIVRITFIFKLNYLNYLNYIIIFKLYLN